MGSPCTNSQRIALTTIEIMPIDDQKAFILLIKITYFIDPG